MSQQKIDRNGRGGPVHFHPQRGASRPAIDAPAFARRIAEALRQDFGDSGSAIKIIALRTGAHERAVRNWFEGKNGPGGAHLVALMACSDRVLDEVLDCAGRHHVARDLIIASLSANILTSLRQIEDITSN